MTRIEWLNERRSGIGGSDAANILGVGYRSPESVYRSKIESVSEQPPTGVLRRGLDLEDIVASMYREVMQEEIVLPGTKIVRNPDRPWQLASLDRVRTDDRPVELKTTLGFSDGFGPSGTDQVPEDYRIQCLHQMAVMDADFCDLVALDLITWEPRVYRIFMDSDQAKMLTQIEERFWNYVSSREPLPADWADQVAPTAQRITVKGTLAELPESVVGLIEKRKTYGEIKAEAEEEYKKLSDQINDLLGDAESGICAGWKVKRVHVAAHEVASHFRKSSNHIRITPIKEKRIK